MATALVDRRNSNGRKVCRSAISSPPLCARLGILKTRNDAKACARSEWNDSFAVRISPCTLWDTNVLGVIHDRSLDRTHASSSYESGRIETRSDTRVATTLTIGRVSFMLLLPRCYGVVNEGTFCLVLRVTSSPHARCSLSRPSAFTVANHAPCRAWLRAYPQPTGVDRLR